MDSITHIVLGATIGEAVAGKQLGRKAMLLGAIAQSIPDVDFILSIWLRPVDNLLAHRGFTHSILFAVLLVAAATFLLSRRTKQISKSRWISFLAIEVSVHLLLDCMNNYGVGLLEPFSSSRIAFNVIYVADPFFSIWTGISFILLIILSVDSPRRTKIAVSALLFSTLYLGYALFNKFSIDRTLAKTLDSNNINYTRLFTTPTPLNNWLWFTAAETESGYYVSHLSVFDRYAVSFEYFPKNLQLINELKDREDLDKLVRFSQGYYTLQKYQDALLFNDLRFGQIAGWSDPRALFAFHYDLYHPNANLFVVQQGRFSHWDRETVSILLDRIKGNHQK